MGNSENYIRSVKQELLDRLGLKQVTYVKQVHDDLFFDAVGFEKGIEHKFRIKPLTGRVDEFIMGKWVRVQKFMIKSTKSDG
ncbi:MAG: hypothetical protein K6T94_15555 [Paenibacillus sp.]|nr:hypothetical protein [Paenibacillus sp.]